MRLLVTGTSGRIGSAIAKRFIRETEIIGKDFAEIIVVQICHSSENCDTAFRRDQGMIKRWGVKSNVVDLRHSAAPLP